MHVQARRFRTSRTRPKKNCQTDRCDNIHPPLQHVSPLAGFTHSLPVPQLTKPGPNASAHVCPWPSDVLGTNAPVCRFTSEMECLLGEASEDEARVVVDRRARNVGSERRTMLGRLSFFR
jgi:hypothetical protein